MEQDDRILARDVLAQQRWLQGHGADLAQAVMTHGRLTRLAPGQWVQGEGDEDTGILVVVSGLVRLLCQAPGDREVLVGLAGAGLAIGQTVRFGGGPRLLTAECAEESLVLVVSDHALSRIAADAPQIWPAVATLLYQQLRNLVQMVAEAAALPPKARLAARLGQLAEMGGPDGLLKVSQLDLGEMLGLSRKTVNGFLGEFERAGLVRRSYGAVAILDRAGLSRLAGR